MTSHLPPVSVIIPCFNAEKYIEGAIRSVLLQDWPHVEIIVVDDGSTDRSADIVQKTFPQVTLVKQANQGVSMARNSGIQATHGDWIAFLDADDLWLPEKLASQWSAIQANPGTRMCYTAWQTWQSEDPTPSDSVLS